MATKMAMLMEQLSYLSGIASMLSDGGNDKLCCFKVCATVSNNLVIKNIVLWIALTTSVNHAERLKNPATSCKSVTRVLELWRKQVQRQFHVPRNPIRL